MARQGAYILDVNLLEQLNDKIKYSGEKMADIDQQVISHINNVRETLQRQLNIIQTKLGEARTQLSQAESALRACEALQAAAAAVGMPGPSCMLEAGAVAKAQAEVAKWEMRYAQGQQIVGECQQEIAGYNAGGHILISNMSNQQTPKACQLLRGCSDNLQDILNSDVSSLPKETAAIVAAVAGGGGLAAAGVGMANKLNAGNNESAPIKGALFSYLGTPKAAIDKNNRDLEKAWGIKKGEPMSIAEADKQSANPNHTSEYLEDPNGDWFRYNGRMYNRKWDMPVEMQEQLHQKSFIRYRMNPDYKNEYSINCATTSAAYEMRRRGYPIHAKGNPEKEGNLNTWLSHRHNYEIWNNADGSKASPTTFGSWFKKMSPNDYKNFFEAECKDEGRYIVSVSLKGGNGHATILERDKDGKLYFIEPQRFDKYMTDEDGRRNIDDLINRMSPYQGIDGGKVMRVDDKLLNPKYANLFEIESDGK